jgi:hypothetical protein
MRRTAAETGSTPSGRVATKWLSKKPRPLVARPENVAVARAEPNTVFLNIPYDAKFERLYLAYIVGLIELGLKPRATLAIPGGTARLERIIELIQSCAYSVHDLSRVQMDRTPPPTPRFNMPFELGLAVSWARLNPRRHDWFVFESENRRAQKSISDLNGTDLNIHDGTIEGVMRELCNAFVRTSKHPTVPEMLMTYRELRRLVPEIVRRVGAGSVFEARTFEDLCVVAAALRQKRDG